MEYPVLLNVEFTRGNQTSIGQGIIDLHPDSITAIIKHPKGFTIIRDQWGAMTTLLHPFEDIVKIYEHNKPIDKRFEDIVKEYNKDNFDFK